MERDGGASVAATPSSLKLMGQSASRLAVAVLVLEPGPAIKAVVFIIIPSENN